MAASPKQPVDDSEFYPDADKRRDDTIRRMLATPPNAPRSKPVGRKAAKARTKKPAK
jgi:hypothetical protein